MECKNFAGCTNEAVGTVPNNILGPVPSCERCAQVVGLPLTPFEKTS